MTSARYAIGRKHWVEPKAILIIIGCIIVVGVFSLFSIFIGGR
jgi:hypothetical protein